MAISPVNNTNLLAQYAATSKPAVQTPAPVNSSDIINKQKRMIELQQEEINNLKQSQQKPANNAAAGVVATLLTTLGIFVAFEFITKLFTRRPPRQQEVNQAYEEIQQYLTRMFQTMADETAAIPPPVPKPKHIIEALWDSTGKQIGKIIKDRDSERVLKKIEFYPKTEVPMTIEKFDYKNDKRYYIWNRADGTKMWEEIFELIDDTKIGTIFYEADGKTIQKVRKGPVS